MTQQDEVTPEVAVIEEVMADACLEGSSLEGDALPPRIDSKPDSSLFSAFASQVAKEPSIEGKVRVGIESMRMLLAASQGNFSFKDFWEVRRQTLAFFKEPLAPRLRSQLWNSYVELSLEFKRLKEVLDEQAAFASEQIELAIQAVERDIEHMPALLAGMKPLTVAESSAFLKEKRELYTTLQQEISLLSTLASSINALRKEVLKTDMRIRTKNKFLDRLSACGDSIFPRRKEKIAQISNSFAGDIEQFVSAHFNENELRSLPLAALRDEVKQLQLVAKELTLSNPIFTKTRLQLSSCWDQLREKEKARRIEVAQRREQSKQNFDLAKEQVTPFALECAGTLSRKECEEKVTSLLNFLRTLELGRDELHHLKEEIFKAKKVCLSREEEGEACLRKQEEEKESVRKERWDGLKTRLESLIETASGLEVAALISAREEIAQQLGTLSLTKAEKYLADRLFKQFKDRVDEQRVKALLDLSVEDQRKLQDLKELLKERKERRQEIKNQLETYRKLLGGSSLDFEKAMFYRELIETEKGALEKMQALVEELEEKIDDIESA